jgi:dienelactone hydrolase
MRAVLIALAAWATLSGVSAAQTPSLLEFAADYDIEGASLSPSGRYVAAISQQPDGDRLIIIDTQANTATPIAAAARGVNNFDVFLEWVEWKTDDRLIYALRAVDNRPTAPDSSRRGTYRVQSINRSGADIHELMDSRESGWTDLADILPSDPNNVLLAAPDGDNFAIFRANVMDGSSRTVESSSRYLGGWSVNRNGEAVFRYEYPREGGGYRIARRAPGTRNWEPVVEILAETYQDNKTFNPIEAGPRPEEMYVLARPEGSNFTAVYLYNTATGAYGEPVAQSDHGDIHSIYVMPGTYELAASCTYGAQRACRMHNAAYGEEWTAISGQLSRYGETYVADMSEDGQTWLIYTEGPTNPGMYALYTRANHNLAVISRVSTRLTEQRLSPQEVVTYRTRDNVELWGYLTRPRNASGRLPLIVMPHGGPHARDYADYDFVVQFLASRGYAVFQPQFRGSEGFGRAFEEQGYGQWGGRMQDDVTDAVRALVTQGVADESRVCIAGISYGAYTALQGAVSTPEMYRCAIGIAGVYDLGAWSAEMRRRSGTNSLGTEYLRQTLGTIDDRAALQRISPARNAGSINVPVLLVHGEIDWVAPFEQATGMRNALSSAGKSVQFLEIQNLGHPFIQWGPYERAQLLTAMDTFLTANMPAR